MRHQRFDAPLAASLALLLALPLSSMAQETPAPTQLGIVIVEGLDLRRVAPGDYTLWCLPLKVVGADGAPCRAVLSR